ncbi:hypothetical protein N7448_004076 [Penicillium atrosanguineum]|uniref:uncharacterized protein n=1 Tax=Penicillium atrosanguineum TaxID=1132637 RepID=UPI0023826CAA|nr:uncharacterized protein N7443_003039 [Penicillium atrosanguineum]KAJ5140668.1 hypothetical protein N7448_004076 [Penicillium atrosanguineum]KAJ5310578.1 hypothetical protein N7443_003039 [Penicillium atrosanguineum]
MNPSALLGLLAFAAAVSAAPSHHQNAHSSSSIKNLKNHIKNVVILEMENRSFDNLLGGQTLKGLENPINNGPYCNPYNLTDSSQGHVCSGAKDFDSILDDPDHSVTGNNIEFYGTFTPSNEAIASGKLTPHQKGFVHEQLRRYGDDVDKTELAKQVINYYTEDEVPVFTSLVQNYLTFNHWHSDHPGPTNPNRAFVLSGTSSGHGTNDDSFYEYGLTQRSIFQQLSETNHTWKNYYTNTEMVDAWFYNWTITSGNKGLAQPLTSFYSDAANGTLPEFSFIDPSCCGVGTNSMHPTGLISDGETFIKNVYDALRASPQWDETLFILTFDETGGFHDHVPPPLAARPDDLTYTETAPNGQNYTFSFDRLGGRIPTILISPWVGKGLVEQKGKDSNGKTVSYSASSILRTLGYLWDFEPFTPRVGASPSFDHLVRTVKRDDTPTALPEPNAFKARH